MWPIVFSMGVARRQRHRQVLFDCSLCRRALKGVLSASCIGITFSGDMDWGRHISEISSKATGTLGFLRGNWAFEPGGAGGGGGGHAELWFGLGWSMPHPFGALAKGFRLVVWGGGGSGGGSLGLREMARHKWCRRDAW